MRLRICGKATSTAGIGISWAKSLSKVRSCHTVQIAHLLYVRDKSWPEAICVSFKPLVQFELYGETYVSPRCVKCNTTTILGCSTASSRILLTFWLFITTISIKVEGAMSRGRSMSQLKPDCMQLNALCKGSCGMYKQEYSSCVVWRSGRDEWQLHPSQQDWASQTYRKNKNSLTTDRFCGNGWLMLLCLLSVSTHLLSPCSSPPLGWPEKKSPF